MSLQELIPQVGSQHLGAGLVMPWIKLLSAMLPSHLSVGSQSWLPHFPVNVPEKAVKYYSNVWTPVTHIGVLGGILDF